MEKVPMTIAGERTLRERLKHMKEVERPNVVKAIEEARAHGDLSENAEYHSAREKQGMIEAQIRDLEDRLGRAEVIDTSRLSGDRVVFGATVVLEDGEADEQVTYQIVGTEEADPKAGRISYTSPLARAIIGKREGDLVQFRAPAGVREYEVIEIRFE
ncbi:MAG: transcription elongation factor GreA [Deltaproteobacteria bacterium]|nr:transcription elongation factor GreA [Deltaproteobacteria bacterium]